MRTSATLPPLQALRAFEAVGRLLSFRKAGEELLITQSAVSHHIRQLEETLGLSLFVRKARGIDLTPEGELYLERTARAFGLMADATADLRMRAKRSKVRISLLPSLAANWLVSRLPGFNTLHPDIDLELDPTLQLVDFAAGKTDIAIRYGDGNWKRTETRLIVGETLAPVINPRILGGETAFWPPADVLKHTLLLAKKGIDWEVWAEAVGIDISKARTIQLTDYNITLQAALDGQGVAMGRALLIQEHLRSGRLVQPYGPKVTSPRVGHWLVMPLDRKITTATQLFVDWLIQEATTDVTRLNGRSVQW